MAINLASRYSSQIDAAYTHESFVAGLAKGKFDFTGVKSVKIYSPITVPLNDYDRGASSNRFGTPQEMQDEVQELIVNQDKSFVLAIDAGNASEQMGTKRAAERLRQQMREQVVPAQDKHAIACYVKQAGAVVGLSSLTESNIVKAIAAAQAYMDNKIVPSDGRYCLIGATNCALLADSGKVIYNQGIAGKAYAKGEVFEVCGFKVIKIPDSYLPDGAKFLCLHGDSVVNPHKVQHAKVNNDPDDIDGSLLTGRFIYDAFVLGKKCGGVYAGVDSAKKQAAPTISVSGTTATITSEGASSIKVTTDGSDPRYSASAMTISTGGTVTVGASYTVKAVAYGTFTSDVAEKTK